MSYGPISTATINIYTAAFVLISKARVMSRSGMAAEVCVYTNRRLAIRPDTLRRTENWKEVGIEGGVRDGARSEGLGRQGLQGNSWLG